MRSLARSSALLPGGRRTKFAVLGVLPLVFLTEIGFTIAVGILIDTFIVRSLLVPAITLKIGDNVWWPSQLATSAGRHRPGPAAGRPAYETD
jgi:RND superfamily putative drug exporter